MYYECKYNIKLNHKKFHARPLGTCSVPCVFLYSTGIVDNQISSIVTATVAIICKTCQNCSQDGA